MPSVPPLHPRPLLARLASGGGGRIFHDQPPSPDPLRMSDPGQPDGSRAPEVLIVSTFGIDRFDRFGMANRQAAGLSGRPPKRNPLHRRSNVELYRSIHGAAIGACDAMAAGEMREALIALVRVQEIAAFAVQRFERAHGREALIRTDPRNVTVIQIPAFNLDDLPGAPR